MRSPPPHGTRGPALEVYPKEMFPRSLKVPGFRAPGFFSMTLWSFWKQTRGAQRNPSCTSVRRVCSRCEQHPQALPLSLGAQSPWKAGQNTDGEPHPRGSGSVGLSSGLVRNASSQVMLKLPVWGPHSESTLVGGKWVWKSGTPAAGLD